MTDDGQRQPAVVARGLEKSYGERRAVDRIDFEVPAGICFGFLGPNGAGKTTTMKMIYGLAGIGGGELRVLGLDAVRDRRRIKARIGVVPQETNLDGELTVRENLVVHASYFGLPPDGVADRVEELLDFTLLARSRRREHLGAVGRYEAPAAGRQGARQRAPPGRPGRADHRARPPGAPGGVAGARAPAGGGVTLLLTTHYMEEAARLCDRLLIMDHGRIVAEGEPGGAGARARRPRGARAGARRGLRRGGADRLARRAPRRARADEDALMLYADDAEEALRVLDHERFPTDSAMVRNATLEDVFLRLTGRSLDE